MFTKQASLAVVGASAVGDFYGARFSGPWRFLRPGRPSRQALSAIQDPASHIRRYETVMWWRFLFIAGVGGVTALARSPVDPLLKSRLAGYGERRSAVGCRAWVPEHGQLRAASSPGDRGPGGDAGRLADGADELGALGRLRLAGAADLRPPGRRAHQRCGRRGSGFRAARAGGIWAAGRRPCPGARL